MKFKMFSAGTPDGIVKDVNELVDALKKKGLL